MAALTVFVLGCGIGALGLVEEDLYVIGAVIAVIGAIGVLVRFADLYRWTRE